MIKLPPALRPWAAQLDLFPEDLALALGTMLPSVDLLLGGSHDKPAPRGPPDGYDGLAQRGPLERLASSAWLLLSDLPDEFHRRLDAGELPFLQLTYTGEAARRSSLLWFDAGPEQLGAPRVVQLAVLVVLAQRARARGASLRWGILQDERCEPFAEINPATVAALLAARTRATPSAEQLSRWLAATATVERSEAWLVGGTSTASLARPGIGAVTLTERSELAEHTSVQIRVLASPDSSPRTATVQIPPPELAVRLVRDPFAVATAPPLRGVPTTKRGAPDTRPQLSWLGTRLFQRSADGSLLSFKVPSSLGVEPQPPASFRPREGETLFAVQSMPQRKTLALTHSGTTITVHALSKNLGAALTSREFWWGAAPPWVPPPEPLTTFASFEDGQLAFVDGDGGVVRLHDGRAYHAWTTPVVASYVSRNDLWWVTSSQRDLTICTSNFSGLTPGAELTLRRVQRWKQRAHGDAPMVLLWAPEQGHLAMSGDGDEWILTRQRGGRAAEADALRVAPGARVTGVIELPGEAAAALLVLDSSARKLSAVHRGGHTQLVFASSPIHWVTVAASRRELAFVTAAGGVGVYSTKVRGMLLQIEGDA